MLKKYNFQTVLVYVGSCITYFFTCVFAMDRVVQPVTVTGAMFHSRMASLTHVWCTISDFPISIGFALVSALVFTLVELTIYFRSYELQVTKATSVKLLIVTTSKLPGGNNCSLYYFAQTIFYRSHSYPKICTNFSPLKSKIGVSSHIEDIFCFKIVYCGLNNIT